MSRRIRARKALTEFFALEAASALLLLAAALIAIVWANSPWSHGYATLRHDLHVPVNEGLMAIFFLVVGLEIKRELVDGELSSWRQASLPVVAAVGGMVVPALLYVAIAGPGESGQGWGIPMATDIAFAIGVLALLGTRAPAPLKLFLLALAIADDIGAVLVIAIFYSKGVEPVWLLAAAVTLGAMIVLWKLRVRWIPLHAVLAIAVWAAMFESGVHATIAGVIVGLLAPAGDVGERLEHRLHPISSYFVVPLFALANAGVELSGGPALDNRVVAAVIVGLVVGKTLGITGASWLAVRAKVAELPQGMTWLHLVGGAAVAGIGFTVSLFVSELAFDDETLVRSATIGVLAASLGAGALGAALLSRARRSAS